jgi:hypothetical protein
MSERWSQFMSVISCKDQDETVDFEIGQKITIAILPHRV